MDNFRQRLCFSTPTAVDVLLDREMNNEHQDLILFFGSDNIGNTIIVCVNNINDIKQCNSLIYICDHTGSIFIDKETDNGSYGFSNWKTSSLQFQCVVPMQTWRIVFSGRLRNGENYHHVKINFLWKPFGFPVYCDKNNTFFKHEIDNVGNSDAIRNLLGYDQFGQISGTMVVDDKTEMINMSGIKLRRWSMSMDDLVFAGFMDGVGLCSVQQLKKLNFRGHVKINSEHAVLSPSEIRFSNEKIQKLSIEHKTFNLYTNLRNGTPIVVLNCLSIATVFEDDSNGIILCFRDVPKIGLPIKCEQNFVENYDGLSVDLNSEICARSDLVGNKGKSLYLLKKSIADGLINDAIVPDGICITTIAMIRHINENKDLSICLNDALKIAKCEDFQRLSDYCERLKSLWQSSEISAELSEAISNSLRKSDTTYYAVRSSGTFEDGESTSSAGQYDTKLGCVGHDVAAAVLECWSSNFSARSIIYRKNNGQPLMCDMAVVVQDQVDAQVSGVAFTRDPNTGDPEKITIAASYGTGEGVVSGAVDSDTVVISRRFATISTAIKPSSTSVRTDLSEENDAPKPRCLSDNLLKRLAKLCVLVEDAFGSPQDVEWAIDEDRIYLLQSRPITSIFVWSDDEITHEFDTPFTCDDVVMFYNVKEVYPNPIHPLSLTLDFFSVHPLFKLTEGEPTDIYRRKQLLYTHYNLCLNVCQMFQDLEPDSVYVKIIEYSIAGKHFLTDDIWEKILLTSRGSLLKTILKLILTIKEIIYIESRLIETNRLIQSINVEQSDSTSDLLNKINDITQVLEKVTFCHVASSSNNILSHTLIAILGLDFNKDSTTDTLSKFAVSIDTSDIINVLILKDIQTIANIISETPLKKEFCDSPVENCYNWLKINCEKGHKQVDDFLKKYGHRGVQELDFGSETWLTNPDRLFSCIQSLILSNCHQPHKKPTEDNLDTFSGGYVKKMVFDYLLKRYHQSISYREQSKDMLVRITHEIRLGYRKLGKMLVEDEKIPDSKLVFFMSQYEVKTICDQNHHPDIVHKALKRRKLWSTLSSLQFDDVYCGPPVPKINSDEVSVESSVRLEGCCVYPGRVRNRACVLERIEDARYLQTGDILIVKSIDIAWSPYFPIISGLVTEIGGIISHGAVVAREYGLPCLVGVCDVRKHFKTGDIAVLDSRKGFVIKDDGLSN